MRLREALSICSEAAEIRAKMWAEATNGYIKGSKELDCFDEADKHECLAMAVIIGEASDVVATFMDNNKALIELLDEDWGGVSDETL